MPEDQKNRFLESLLKQEPSFTSSEYKEYRTMLESKLATAERRLRNRRRLTIGVWILNVTLFFVGLLVASPIMPPAARPVGTTLLGLASIMFYLSLLRLFMYLVFERRSAELVRNEARDAVLMELARKVDAIAQRLDGAGNAPAK